MKTLVIVESAAKAKTIQKYLNSASELGYSSFQVMASLGHIRDIPVKEMGVDLTTWEAAYQPIPGKQKIIAALKKAVKEADAVLIASDPDMEGEAIAYHLQKELRIPNARRISFREITKSALVEAVKNPRDIDHCKVAAQESRRILDRVVGYELSPLLWRRFSTSTLSAGRVQSAALKMLVDRAQQVKDHNPSPYWELFATFKAQPDIQLDGEAHDCMWEIEDDIKKLIRIIHKKAWDSPWTATFTQKATKQNPSAPFTTSSLQQEAYNRLNLPAKKVMQLAQTLYERGYITYMRTDSTTLSKDVMEEIHSYIEQQYPNHAQSRVFKTRASNAQEAHEAIRPSKVHVRAEDIENEDVTSLHKRLYDLIWRRTVASQMTCAVYTDVLFSIQSSASFAKNLDFRGKHSVLVEEGYLKIYSPNQKAAPESLKVWADALEKGTLSVSPVVFEARGNVTKPVGMMNEPMLVKALEKEGIGRPSTYATIIDKLFTKGYVSKGMPPQIAVQVASYKAENGEDVQATEATVSVGGKDTDRLIPSSLGERVAEYLTGIVPFMVNTSFTASMEADLDHVSTGQQKKNELLQRFYDTFHGAVESALEEQKKVKATKPKAVRKSPPEPAALRTFDGTNVVQTRFGPALFVTNDKRFISLAPFFEWKGKTVETLTEIDVKFLVDLPRKYANTSVEIHLGRYGLYIKNGSKNIRLPKELWDDIYQGSEDVDSIKQQIGRPRGTRSAS